MWIQRIYKKSITWYLWFLRFHFFPLQNLINQNLQLVLYSCSLFSLFFNLYITTQFTSEGYCLLHHLWKTLILFCSTIPLDNVASPQDILCAAKSLTHYFITDITKQFLGNTDWKHGMQPSFAFSIISASTRSKHCSISEERLRIVLLFVL